MRDLQTYSSPAEIASSLRRLEKRATKGLGQNFLIDENIINKILSSASPDERSAVIEVGPGLGAITSRLLLAAGKLVAIEIDDKLWAYLEEEFGSEENFELIKSDALKCDLKALCDRLLQDYERIMLVSNLPYQITTPLLMKVFEEGLPLSKMVLMVQLELADRLAAKAGSKDYGALTVNVGTYAYVNKLFEVKPGSFLPPPKVSSAVIELVPRFDAMGDLERIKLISIVKAAFHARRKKMVNSISESMGLDKALILKVLAEMGLREDVRAEMLSAADFTEFAKRLENYKL